MKKSLCNNLINTALHEDTRFKKILSLEDIDTKKRNDNFKNLELDLIQCPYCYAPKQKKLIPKCLITLHVYGFHCNQPKIV